jgi:hypothetical protein
MFDTGYMHCWGISYTRSFYNSLTSAEGQQYQFFGWTENYIFKVVSKSSKPILLYSHARILPHPNSLYVYTMISTHILSIEGFVVKLAHSDFQQVHRDRQQNGSTKAPKNFW